MKTLTLYEDMSKPTFDMQSGLFQVRLGAPDQPVDLSLLEQLAERIRGAFREIVREQTGDTKAQIRLLIRDARKDSIVLSVEPELTGEAVPSAAEVTQTLISDINSLAAGNARPNMSANLLGQYREMMKIGQRAGRLELGYGQARSAVEAIQNDPERERAYQEQGGTMEEFYQKMLAAGIARKEPYNVVSPGESTGVKVGFLIRYGQARSAVGPENEIAFEAAIREQPEAGVQMVGSIETVNIHSRPWTFGLYTKLDRQRVECRFGESMLDDVLRLMDAKTLVQVTGEGRFAPVGITPRVIELLEPPIALTFDAEALRSYRRSADIAKEGESAAEAVRRIREEIEKFA